MSTHSDIQAVLDNQDKDVVVMVNRRKKATTQAELEQLPHDELVVRMLALQAHNTQLTNLLRKEQAATQALLDEKQLASRIGSDANGDATYEYDTGIPAKQRKHAFQHTHKRHVLLKFYYLGWDYHGFTTQEHTNQTIEHQLFKALLKTCLIERRETSNYHRCGRTDKGVSAFSQCISIDLRSRYASDDERQLSAAGLAAEYNYCESLNRVLPHNIRCLAWAPCANAAFSARFDCKRRSYRYFFPRGRMNIEAMREACARLVGVNDFRNLCKMDVQNGVVEFVREIRGADIRLASKAMSDPAYDMFYMELVGKAYLWHQVRCIMAILLLVGQELEQPSVMAELLDVEKNPCTPQYSLASDVALNLWNVEYKDDTDRNSDGVQFEAVRWQYDRLNMKRLLVVLQSQWTIGSVQTTMMAEMLAELEATVERELGGEKVCSQPSVLLEGSKSKVYQPLMGRVKCESLENRIAHFAKKRRIGLQCVKEGEHNSDGESVEMRNADGQEDDGGPSVGSGMDSSVNGEE